MRDTDIRACSSVFANLQVDDAPDRQHMSLSPCVSLDAERHVRCTAVPRTAKRIALLSMPAFWKSSAGTARRHVRAARISVNHKLLTRRRSRILESFVLQSRWTCRTHRGVEISLRITVLGSSGGSWRRDALSGSLLASLFAHACRWKAVPGMPAIPPQTSPRYLGSYNAERWLGSMYRVSLSVLAGVDTEKVNQAWRSLGHHMAYPET